MNKAYVTLITSRKYLCGALVLALSLKNTGTQIPFYVFIPSNCSPDISDTLRLNNIDFLVFDELPCGNIHGSGYWADTLSKLTVFQATNFDKIVFLDSDMILLKNIDFLFDWPHMSAVAAGQELHPDWTSLNSGLMVIEPSKKDYQGIISLVADTYQECIDAGLPFGDQDVIKKYYCDWPTRKECHLPSTLNVMLGYGGVLKKKRILRTAGDIYVYHFTGRQKPWGTGRDRAIILLKMMKRSPHWLIDLLIYKKYRTLMHRIQFRV